MATKIENILLSEKSLRVSVQESASPDFCGDLTVQCLVRYRYLSGRRAVWQARCKGRDVLLKLYDVHAKQERDVRNEWQNALSLFKMDVNLPEPLFLGKLDDGRLAVAFDYIDGGQTLDAFLERAEIGWQAEVFNQLVVMHARQHAMGAFQKDDHLGNYLWADGKLWMLDTGSCKIGDSPLGQGDRVHNMSMLAANIPLPIRSSYDAAYVNHYDVALPGIESAIEESIHQRIKKYYKKTRRSCTEFERLQNKNGYCLARRDVDPELKEKVLADPDQFFLAGDDMLKNGRTCSVVEIEHQGKCYILKRYNQKSLLYRLFHMVLTPRPLLSWSNGQVLRLFGVPTPRNLLCYIFKKGMLFEKGYLLMEKAEGDCPCKMDRADVEDPKNDIPGQFASRCHELTSLKATHGDMKATNFIFDRLGLLQLIDLDSLVFHRSKRRHAGEMQKDLARFMRNWEGSPELIKLFEAGLVVRSPATSE